MKKVDLEALLDEISFEEITEECAYTIEGSCGSGFNPGWGTQNCGVPVEWLW